MTKTRCFVAIDLPEEVRKEIIKIQEKLPEFVGKKTEPENLHLTLKFLGEIDEKKLEIVKEKLEKIKMKQFDAEIDSIGVFSPSFIRIVWLHVSGVDELQKEVDNSLSDIFEKERRFMSHLTIARIKRIKDRKNFLNQLTSLKIPKIKFNVNKFYLKKSTLTREKAVYENLEIYELF